MFGQGLLYSYAGRVTDTTQDSAGIIGNSGIQVGDALAATFVVDLGRAGFYTQNDGSVVFPSSDIHDAPLENYYYDQLVSALPIQMKDGGSFNSSTDVASYNYAFDNFGIAQSYASYGTVLGGNANENIMIGMSDPLDATIGSWQVGDSFEVSVWACDSEQRFSVLEGTVTLTAINPAPEPSAFALLCLAAAVGAFRLRQR
jgi:hypothetical protein